MRFSERIGKTSVRTALQIDSIDEPLKNRLWNTILNDFFENLDNYSAYGGKSELVEVCKYLWTEFFKKRIDQIPQFGDRTVYTVGVVKWIEGWYFKAEWFEIYDFIEQISSLNLAIIAHFTDRCNFDLEKEIANYRLLIRQLCKSLLNKK